MARQVQFKLCYRCEVFVINVLVTSGGKLMKSLPPDPPCFLWFLLINQSFIFFFVTITGLLTKRHHLARSFTLAGNEPNQMTVFVFIMKRMDGRILLVNIIELHPEIKGAGQERKDDFRKTN